MKDNSHQLFILKFLQDSETSDVSNGSEYRLEYQRNIESDFSIESGADV